MNQVIPTVTATNPHSFRSQLELISTFAKAVHIDLASSDFYGASPLLDFQQVYFEPSLTSSVHLMYQDPLPPLKYILSLDVHPSLVILQAESNKQSLSEAIKLIKDSKILLGIALLQDTQPEDFIDLIKQADQILIFSGNLGEHGGTADLSLVSKIPKIKKANPQVQIAWDGGINSENILKLEQSGVEIFYVGGAIHKSSSPAESFNKLQLSLL